MDNIWYEHVPHRSHSRHSVNLITALVFISTPEIVNFSFNLRCFELIDPSWPFLVKRKKPITFSIRLACLLFSCKSFSTIIANGWNPKYTGQLLDFLFKDPNAHVRQGFVVIRVKLWLAPLGSPLIRYVLRSFKGILQRTVPLTKTLGFASELQNACL